MGSTTGAGAIDMTRIEEQNAVRWAFVLVIIGMMLGLLMAGTTEPTDPYCEMVTVWNETGGEYGWPDYRGNGECVR